MVRCKACGYIMSEGKLGDRCPACGAPKTSFEPYTDPVAATRRKVLDMHLHPMAVHFPTAFAVAVLVFAIAATFLSGDAQNLINSTSQILALFLPIVVIVAFVAGWLDGVVRFRKVKNSQILKRKIIYALCLLVVSLALALFYWLGASGGLLTWSAILLGAVAVILAALLGRLGMSIGQSAFPGK